MSEELLRSAVDRLPHGPRARWVRRGLGIDGETLIAEGGAPPGCTLVQDGRLPVYTTLELCAQSAALLEIVEALQASDASGSAGGQGYIVRARRVRLHAPDVDADAVLRATVRRTGAAPPLFNYGIEVHDGERLLLSGTVSTFVP